MTAKMKKKKTIEYSFIRKMTHVAVPQILLSTKLSHPSPGHMPGILEHRKDHVHYQNHVSDVVIPHIGKRGGTFSYAGGVGCCERRVFRVFSFLDFIFRRYLYTLFLLAT